MEKLVSTTATVPVNLDDICVTVQTIGLNIPRALQNEWDNLREKTVWSLIVINFHTTCRRRISGSCGTCVMSIRHYRSQLRYR